MPNNSPSETEIMRAALGQSKECPTLDQLERLTEDAAPVPAGLAQHLKSCAYCQTELHLLHSFLAGEARQGNEDVRQVTANLRTRQSQTTLMTVPTPPSFAGEREPWWKTVFTVRHLAPASLAMAAVLLVVAAVVFYRHGSQPVFEATNHGGPEVFRSSSLTVVSPTGDLQERPSEVRWEPVPGAAKYQVRLLEVDRSEMWKTETSENRIELPGAVQSRIVPAKTLFCEVSAFNSSGAKIGETGLVRFRLMQKTDSH
jgi:hypothetical protein